MGRPTKAEKPPGPDDDVRYVAKCRREERARFRYFCDRVGHDAERLGWQWIMDRLAIEERKLERR